MRRTAFVAAIVCAVITASLSVGVALTPPALTTDVTRVTYPGVVTLSATATADSQSATFRMLTPGAAAYSVLGTVPVSYADTAVYSFIVRPRRNATYTVEVDGMPSEPVYVAVHTPLTKPVAPSLVRPGKQVTFTGTIRPVHPGPNIDVQLQRWNSRTRRWERKTTTAVASVAKINGDTTKWTYKRTFWRRDSGRWAIRAAHLCPNHAQSYSEWKYFSVL